MEQNLEKKGPLKLQPGELIPKEVLNELSEINKRYSKNRNFSNYLKDLEELFGASPVAVSEKSQAFLGGFLEGEASLNVSAKKLKNAQFGMLIDPEFSVTQHVNGISSLLLALKVFQTGRIRYKAGSIATMVYVVDSRKTLEEKVLPFYEKYVNPFGSPAKANRFAQFNEVLRIFREEGHRSQQVFVTKLLPLWDSMRMQKGQTNESFPDLQAAQEFVKEFLRNKKKE